MTARWPRARGQPRSIEVRIMDVSRQRFDAARRIDCEAAPRRRSAPEGQSRRVRRRWRWRRRMDIGPPHTRRQENRGSPSSTSPLVGRMRAEGGCDPSAAVGTRVAARDPSSAWHPEGRPGAVLPGAPPDGPEQGPPGGPQGCGMNRRFCKFLDGDADWNVGALRTPRTACDGARAIGPPTVDRTVGLPDPLLRRQWILSSKIVLLSVAEKLAPRRRCPADEPFGSTM